MNKPAGAETRVANARASPSHRSLRRLLLYLLRHGETDWNVEQRIQGVSDTTLNDVGVAQAEALACALRGRPISRVYSSPLNRARRTAEIIAHAVGVPLLDEAGIAELDQGELEGMTFRQLPRTHPDFMALWQTRPAEARMPGGENLAELQERAWAAVERFLAAHENEVIAAVSHNLTIITILCRILGLGLNGFRRLRQHNASLNIVEHTPGRGWNVVTMNSLAHLQDAPVSERNPYMPYL